jgi:predicted GIY-YIG superfamily endonuclease
MWYVYGLKCSDKSLYIGSTNNLKRRIKEHNDGQSLGIKGRLPCFLEFYIAVKNERISRELEKYLKTGSGKAIIKKRILADGVLT